MPIFVNDFTPYFFVLIRNTHKELILIAFGFSLRFCSARCVETQFSSTRLALGSPRFSLPPEVSCFIILFACIRGKRLEFPIEIHCFASKFVFFAFSLGFYSGLKKHCKTPVKVSEMLPKPSFLHAVPAENRFFENEFEKTIFSRDRLQKLINLTLLQLFYSITFLVQKTLLSREKVCLRIPNGRFRTPRVDKVAVATVPCVFFGAHVQ